MASNISREPVDGCSTPAEEARLLSSDPATAAQSRLAAVGYLVGVVAAGLAWLLTITTRHVALAGAPLAGFALYFAYRAFDIWTRRLNQARKHAAQLSEAAQTARAALVRATMSEAALGAEKDRLALQTARMAATLRTIGDGVITVNEAGSVLLINEAAESLTGLTRAGMLDKPVQALFDALGYPPNVTTQALKRVMVEGQPVQLRHDVANANERRLVDITGTPTRDADALVRGAVWVIRNVGDAARLEMERSRATRLESLGTLAGGLAHDFNNILVGVVGNLSVAQSMLRDEDAAIAARLAEAELACIRARGVTNQLLTFAKGGAPVKTTASMPELVVECSRFALSGSAVAPRFSFDSSVWSAEVDVTQTGQVVHNLVLNAMQAMPRGGVVTIGLENIEVTSTERWQAAGMAPGDYVRLSVEDTGQGIPPQHLGHIFDPYYTTKEKASGLGLAICYSIVRAHGGVITVDSRPGEACRFDVYLPANRRAAAEAAAPTPPRRRQGRVLLMDDDTEVVEVTRDMLQMLGYDAETTACGTMAIERFRQETERGGAFDAVVLDLTVPGGMGGADAVRGIRAIRPEVPVVVTSGYADDAVLAHFREYGFDGVLPKPFGLADLTKALKEAEMNALSMREQQQRIA